MFVPIPPLKWPHMRVLDSTDPSHSSVSLDGHLIPGQPISSSNRVHPKREILAYYSLARDADWVPGMDPQESVFRKPQVISIISQIWGHYSREFELRDTETTVGCGGYWTRIVVMLELETLWGQMLTECLEDIAWGVEEQERQRRKRGIFYTSFHIPITSNNIGSSH